MDEMYPSWGYDLSELWMNISELWMKYIRTVDEMYPSGWVEILPTNANDATVQGSIPAFSDTAESKYLKTNV